MGLLKTVKEAGRSILQDQWLEFVTLEDASENVLVQREYPRTKGGNKGNSNILTNGTRIVVPAGFAMAIIDQGAIVEFSAEPGEFTYDTSTEPSIFYGGLGKGIVDSFKKWGERIAFGGDIPKDTRVYYVNLREILGNKFGTSKPVPFDDPKYQTIYLRYFGQYSLHVSDPVVLLQNLVGTASRDRVLITDYIGHLKAEFVASLTSAMSRLAYEKNISFNRLPMFQDELGMYMNTSKDDAWKLTRGLEIVSVAIESIDADDKSQEMIRDYDKMYFGEVHGRGMMTAATADAMKLAAKNEGGNAGMFMGMGVGGMMSGAMNAGSQMGLEQTENPFGQTMRAAGTGMEPSTKNTWTCSCGTENQGKFCSECGNPKPERKEWTCSCGTTCTGNFCPNCGQKKPAEKWMCSCGTENEGKFCMNCGQKRP